MMQQNIVHCDIKINGGLKHPINNWENRTVNILKKCKFVNREADCKISLEPGSVFYQMFQFNFGAGKEAEMGENQCWIVKRDLKV